MNASRQPAERLGATPLGDGRCRFEVWAPAVERVAVQLLGDGGRQVELDAGPHGSFQAVVDATPPGTLYRYVLDEREGFADPASLSQPQGVHGPSRVVDTGAFVWHDAGWAGVELADLVVYELHVGTFTPAGTFAAAAEQLTRLRELGITAVEPMPIAQFPGERNWGYDGVFPFAAQDSYGGPEGFAGFVDAAHAAGLAVVLDVVYNHLGPEGGVHREYGPYFTDAYVTPWGEAINFDGPGSDGVRRYFRENARSWLERFHVDALRLDAIHGIYDRSAVPFLQELAADVDGLAAGLGRRLYAIAESALNDPRVVRSAAVGGLGLHAQWNDDLHHALHAYLTGERAGHLADYGSLADVATAYAEGFVVNGRYSSFHDRRYGASSLDVPAQKLVVFAQNHDQVGNRPGSARLATDHSFEELKLLAGAVILSPYVPLLFMGEEYGEKAPFPYFVSHSDPELVEAVRRGRRRELEAMSGASDCPDPQDESTFVRARPDRSVLAAQGVEGERARLLERFYRELLGLRRALPGLRPAKDRLVVLPYEDAEALVLLRAAGEAATLVVLAFSEESRDVRIPSGVARSALRLDSADRSWGGPGGRLPGVVRGGDVITPAPHSVALYVADAPDTGRRRS